MTNINQMYDAIEIIEHTVSHEGAYIEYIFATIDGDDENRTITADYFEFAKLCGDLLFEMDNKYNVSFYMPENHPDEPTQMDNHYQIPFEVMVSEPDTFFNIDTIKDLVVRYELNKHSR